MDIATFAKGYLSLVGASTGGVGLRQAADYLQPTFDIFELLALSVRKAATQGTAVLNTGNNGLLVVPDKKIWVLRGFGVTITTGAASSCQGSYLNVTNLDGASGQLIPLSGNIQNMGANERTAIVATNLPLLLPGGAQLNVYGASVAGTVQWSGGGFYDEFSAA